jgi:phosphate transport system substrate-binding protein
MGFKKIIFVSVLILANAAFAGESLKGVGSALAAPLFNQWSEVYQGLHPEVKIKYESKNINEGLAQWLGRDSDFAVTDTPLTSEEERRALSRSFLRLPVAIQAVVISYNLPGIRGGLRLSPGVISNIFLGSIRKWNDPAIAELNPGLSLPSLDILVVNRPEESSPHDLFPSCLLQWDPEWASHLEGNRSFKWPVGQKVNGNEKVLEKMRKWPGVIAALDFSYAAQNHLPMAQVRNSFNQFVEPTLESISASTLDFVSLPEDFQVILTRSRTPQAYPLCSFSWLMVYQDLWKVTRNHKKGRALADFLDWILNDGQKLSPGFFFAPLPDPFLTQARERARSIQY